MHLSDTAKLRNLMVDTQLIPRGIKDIRVLNAMRKVPRHLFVGESLQHKAYDDILGRTKIRHVMFGHAGNNNFHINFMPAASLHLR